MNPDIDAVGDVVSGALLAQTIEGVTGEGGLPGAHCFNCGTILHGKHCHGCGQAGKLHRTLSAFGHDIFHSVLHFDGKIWRTLPLLVWRPGELTRRYVHGERAKFVSPIALFLFMVFFSFAVFHAVVSGATDVSVKQSVTAASAAKELAADKAEIQGDIAALEADKKQALTDGQPVAYIDESIARNREALAALEAEKAPEIRQKAIAERKLAIQKLNNSASVARLEAKLAAAKQQGKPLQAIEDELQAEKRGLNLINAASDLLQNGKIESKWNFTDLDFYGSKSLNEAAKHAAENPQLLLYKIQSSAYKYSWALIPISTPFLWLLFFWRRQFKLFDHAVFVTYSLCFMLTLGAVGAAILSFATEGSAIFVITIFALIFVPPVHLYRQLRHAYQTSSLAALWRTFLLSNFALAALGLFAALIITLGVTG